METSPRGRAESRLTTGADRPLMIFRTCKYVPSWPEKGFESLEAARAWVADFVRWYNGEHRHSVIRFVTPDQRHRQQDRAILDQRHAVYQAARARHPER
ncbi:MAG: transposase [Rhodobacterales bacterium]|nr:transposase [Rhodobacterales bacterium]